MMKKYVILLGLMLLLPSVSALIAVGDVSTLYSIGDELNASIVLSSKIDAYEFLTTELVCGTDRIVLYKSPFSVKANELTNTLISVNLGRALIGSLNGECFLHASYGAEIFDTEKFKISNTITVSAQTANTLFEPGEIVKVSGKTTKENGKIVNGLVEVKIQGLKSSYASGVVTSGQFEVNMPIPKNAPAGDYNVTIYVYDQDKSGIIANDGTASTAIKIKQVIRLVDIALSSTSIFPGEEMLYTILAYDQSGNKIEGETAELRIYSGENKLFSKSTVQSGQQNGFPIGSNYSSGYWGFYAKIENLSASANFNVESKQNVSYTFENSTLVISNIGNVAYNKMVEITVDGNRDVKDVQLEIGETKRFKIYAPNGEYSITVSDGLNSINFGRIFLTGNAFAIKDITSNGNLLIMGWIILIIGLGLLVLYYYNKVSKKHSFARPPMHMAKPKILSAASNLIKNGEKEDCSIITLKIKNLEEIEKARGPALDVLRSGISKAKEAKAKVYSDGNYRTFVFSKILTGEKDNTLLAARIAKEIEASLKEHNKKFAQKIDFGIGVNVGDMIVESIDGNFKFSSLGNVIILSKKISENAVQETLMSDNAHRRITGKARGEKIGEFWRIKHIIDRERHSEFINRFLNK